MAIAAMKVQKNRAGTATAPVSALAKEAARLRAIAQALVTRAKREDSGYRQAAFLATLIDEDNPRIAIKAHQLLVEYTAEMVQNHGLVEAELAPLLMGLHNLIDCQFCATSGSRWYVRGRWLTPAELEAERAKRAAGGADGEA